MRETLIAAFIFVCLLAASLGSLLIYHKIPIRNRQADTIEVVRMVANMFVVITSLVLGLMINSAKNTFEEIDDNVHAYATQLILLDRSLRKLGPEAIDARQPLIAYAQGMVDRKSAGEPSIADNRQSELLIDDIGDGLKALIGMLVAWLVLVFVSLGFRAPGNGVVFGTFVAAAALLAGSVYLILDMDSAFDGPIQVSSVPLERALAEMKE